MVHFSLPVSTEDTFITWEFAYIVMSIATTTFAIIQILLTIGIILVPLLAEHQLNPYQKRARRGINKLKERDGDLFESTDMDEILENPSSLEEKALNIIGEEFDFELKNLEEELERVNIFQGLEIGYVRKNDNGFSILLDAISQNRTIEKSKVTAIGMIFGPTSLIGSLKFNDSMPTGSKVPIGPNAALFVDYDDGAIPQRELIVYYPESPSLTLSLHELELWVSEAIRRKSHYLTAVMAILWGFIPIILRIFG